MHNKESIKKIKKRIIEELLAEGDTMICLDGRNEDVLIPKEHKSNPCLSIILNLGFRRPIKILDEHISAVLSFGILSKYQHCIIPYESIWAAYHPQNKKGMMWAESIPADALLQRNYKTSMNADKAEKTVNPQKWPVSREKSSDYPASNKRKAGGHLRLVK